MGVAEEHKSFGSRRAGAAFSSEKNTLTLPLVRIVFEDIAMKFSHVLLALLVLPAYAAEPAAERLPSGFALTPLAAPGATLQRLPTDLRLDGSADANGAETALRSPDGTALLVLTSGYNTMFFTPAPAPIKHAVPDPTTLRPSTITTPNAEFLFLYDIRGKNPVLKQRLSLPNTYHGVVWEPGGRRFYISAGIDDRIYAFATPSKAASADSTYAPEAPAILLGHNDNQKNPLPAYNGGLFHTTPIGKSPALIAAVTGNTSAVTAGLALSRDARTLAAVNMQNDSLSLIDTATRQVTREIRFFTPGQATAIGELPYWVAIKSDSKGAFAGAYVTSQRDGQILSATANGKFTVIQVGGEPNRLLLSADQSHLYVANGDSDEIEEIDTKTDKVAQRISLLRPGYKFLGAGPSGLTLSPDGETLYVTLDNENALAIIDLRHGRVLGRIPTGWFPSDVAISADGRRLFVANAKSQSGPGDFMINFKTDGGPAIPANGHNGYVLAEEKATLLTFPVPDNKQLATLSAQVDDNNNFAAQKPDPIMAFLHAHIHHVIYVLKENRTYDQVLGDLPQGRGDPSLCMFPRANTPNHHALAERFVLLDNFMSAGDVSGDGWNWMFQGHANTYTNRTTAVDYGNAAFVMPFDWNGMPRNIGVAVPDHATGPQNPATVRITTLLDPTGASGIEPGPKDVTADEGADDEDTKALGGFVWDAALRAGKTVRQYGVYTDQNYYLINSPLYMKPSREAWKTGILQSVSLRPALLSRTDPYYRGWDLNVPDEYRFEAWKHEFDEFVAKGNLPDLELLEFNMDHFGEFATNISGLNTPPLQIGSNDHALGELVEAVSHSKYWNDTAIFVVEDDAQDGADHVDAHRTVAQIISAYTRPGAVVHTRYDTTNFLRTMEDILGITPLGLNDANARPMSEVFGIHPDMRPYNAIIPGVLCHAPADPKLVPQCSEPHARISPRTPSLHDGIWWARATSGMDFTRPDQVNPKKFNAILREGVP
jgi:YVTN family beta-propeller protein